VNKIPRWLVGATGPLPGDWDVAKLRWSDKRTTSQGLDQNRRWKR